MMVRRDPTGVRLLTRNGHDWTGRFSLIAQAAEALRARSFLIDGEAVACDGDGLPVFNRLRYRRQDGRVFLYAFDLLELDGRDMRREPLDLAAGIVAPRCEPSLLEAPPWPVGRRRVRRRCDRRDSVSKNWHRIGTGRNGKARFCRWSDGEDVRLNR